MRQLTANLLQDYFQEQGVDYLSLDRKSQRRLESKHSKKFLKWNIKRKIELALEKKGPLNKLKSRIDLYLDKLRFHPNIAPDLLSKLEENLSYEVLSVFGKEIEDATSGPVFSHKDNYRKLRSTISKNYGWMNIKDLPTLDSELEKKFKPLFLIQEKEVRHLGRIVRKLADQSARIPPVNVRGLEALAKEVGSLQAQPKYVENYGKVLKGIQDQIESKYAVHGKDHKYLEKQFKMAKRASQIRVASQMNRELQREIKALKRDLNK
jgi:hypothetical protein